jgi:hypothetical protein
MAYTLNFDSTSTTALCSSERPDCVTGTTYFYLFVAQSKILTTDYDYYFADHTPQHSKITTASPAIILSS